MKNQFDKETRNIKDAYQQTTTKSVSDRKRVYPINSDKHEGIEIVNQAAYKMWILFEKKKTETKIVRVDSEGLITKTDEHKAHELDLGTVAIWIYKKMADFPSETQEKIKVQKKEYDSYRAHATNWKAKAFGMDYKKKGLDNISVFNILKHREREILELFGKMFSIDEVHQFCVEEWGMNLVTKPLLNKFRQVKIDEITTLIERTKAGFEDIRLGYKRPRLEELCLLYKFAKDNLRKTTQIKYADLARNILKDIKQEVEGDKLVIEGNLEINLDMTINSHVNNNILRNIGLRQLIIGRVAATSGISPFLLVEQLTTSYYSKFSGISGEPSDIEYQNIEYPNDKPYDFDLLTSEHVKNQSLINQKTKDYKSDVIVLNNQGKELDIKDKLLSIIKEVERSDSKERGKLSILERIKFGK